VKGGRDEEREREREGEGGRGEGAREWERVSEEGKGAGKNGRWRKRRKFIMFWDKSPKNKKQSATGACTRE